MLAMQNEIFFKIEALFSRVPFRMDLLRIPVGHYGELRLGRPPVTRQTNRMYEQLEKKHPAAYDIHWPSRGTSNRLRGLVHTHGLYQDDAAIGLVMARSSAVSDDLGLTLTLHIDVLHLADGYNPANVELQDYGYSYGEALMSLILPGGGLGLSGEFNQVEVRTTTAGRSKEEASFLSGCRDAIEEAETGGLVGYGCFQTKSMTGFQVSPFWEI